MPARATLTEIGASPAGDGEHLSFGQRCLDGLVGQADGHDEVREANRMLQPDYGYIIILVTRVLLVLRMHMDMLICNIQCRIRTAQVVGLLNAVRLRLDVKLT